MLQIDFAYTWELEGSEPAFVASSMRFRKMFILMHIHLSSKFQEPVVTHAATDNEHYTVFPISVGRTASCILNCLLIRFRSIESALGLGLIRPPSEG